MEKDETGMNNSKDGLKDEEGGINRWMTEESRMEGMNGRMNEEGVMNE